MPQERAQRSVPIQDFLNPNSMMTPGMAGGLTMLITNALCQHFPLPNDYTGLGLSFMFGLLVFVVTGPLWQRSVYYLLNSLIIFCVAAGASGFGAHVTTPQDGEPSASVLITPAFAHDVPSDDSTAMKSLKAENQALRDRLTELESKLATAKQEAASQREYRPRTRGLSIPSRSSSRLAGRSALRTATARAASTRVPQLVNKDYQSAAAQLKRAGLKVGTVRQRASRSSSGIVVRQSVAAGKTVARGTVVNLDVTARKQFFRKWF